MKITRVNRRCEFVDQGRLGGVVKSPFFVRGLEQNAAVLEIRTEV